MLITIDRSSAEGLQEQLFDQVRRQILEGRLKAGAAVPSSRGLAQQLRISRNSVSFAYERLINEGYLVTRPMVGTFVASLSPEQAMTPPSPGEFEGIEADRLTPAVFTGRQHGILNAGRIPIDFWTQRTDPRAFPLKAWRRLVLHALATAGHNLTEYGDPCGLLDLRAAVAAHVAARRDIRVAPEQVVITSGAQFALNLMLRVLAREGDPIVVENPCNQGSAYLFESLRMTLHAIDVDADGIDTSRLDGVRAKFAYVMPSHHFPIGSMLSLNRRVELLHWAARQGAYVLEDDYDNEFQYNGAVLPALKAMSPDNVIYLGTFSKSLGAGLRLGYAIVPLHLTEATRAAKALMDNGHVWLEQAALAEFLHSGSFMRHLRRIRQKFMSRRDTLEEALRLHFGEVELWGAGAGSHVAWRLPEEFGPAPEAARRARARNIGVYTVRSGGGHEHEGSRFEDRWLLFGYAALTDEQIRSGVTRLAEALKPTAPG